MQNVPVGLAAGFIATVVLSAMMVIKGMMGVMPELNIAAMIGMMMGASVMVGWIAKFMIGTIVCGGGFALLYGLIPGRNAVVKGIGFGVAPWVGMMLFLMTMVGSGLFGMTYDIMAPVMTLLLHVVFGAVLGSVYGMLLQHETLSAV
jgi:hypothetical protein